LKKLTEETEGILKTIGVWESMLVVGWFGSNVYALDEERKQHAAEVKKLEKEKNEKRRELQDISNQIQEATTQIKETEGSIAQVEQLS